MEKLTRYKPERDVLGGMSVCPDGQYVQLDDVRELVRGMQGDGPDSDYRDGYDVALADILAHLEGR